MKFEEKLIKLRKEKLNEIENEYKYLSKRI